MSVIAIAAAEAIARLETFSALVDARSESEFALDHLPGALNWPSLSDEERALVGAEYRQVSPFMARKRGAAMVARNIATHVERHVLELPKDWSPLVYCWRGGQRSGALATVLGQIGFRTHVLEGGYREYRRAILAELQSLPRRLDLRVICGTTGSGKSRLLRALAARHAQVLDLEALAVHRGSVLGLVPGATQPSQKAFDSQQWVALRRLDPERPVYVESESRKIGQLRIAESLVERLRAAPCVVLELDPERRVALLLEEYAHFVEDAESFCACLDALRGMRGREVVDGWQAAARAGRTAEVVRELLAVHYDPIYLHSMRRHFAALGQPQTALHWDGSEVGLQAVVDTLLAMEERHGQHSR